MNRVLSACAILCVMAGMGEARGRCLAAGPPAPAAAQAEPAGEGRAGADRGAETSVTHHAVQAGGRTLKYTATAGCLPLKDQQGKLEAEMFFTAYAREGAKGGAGRPVAFAFNGGPGASSLWLHVGGLGPKRVPLAAGGTALPQTFELVDNESTWLDFRGQPLPA